MSDMTLATLGLRIDAGGFITGVTASNRALDAFGVSGTRAEGIAGLMQRSFTSLAGIMGLGLGMDRIIRESIDSQNAMAQLAAAVQSTGGVAERSVIQLDALAQSLQRTTTFSNDAVKGGEAILLTFGRIRGKEFDAATQMLTDLAARMHTDLPEAALKLGKALEDPEHGLTALRRSGIVFSQDQINVIKQLNETGHAAEAQDLILAGLQTRVGGTAAALRDTLGGALTAVKNNFNDLLKVSQDGTSGLVSGLNSLAESLRTNAQAIKDTATGLGVLAVAFGVVRVALPLLVAGWALASKMLFEYQAQMAVAKVVGSEGFTGLSLGAALFRGQLLLISPTLLSFGAALGALPSRMLFEFQAQMAVATAVGAQGFMGLGSTVALLRGQMAALAPAMLSAVPALLPLLALAGSLWLFMKIWADGREQIRLFNDELKGVDQTSRQMEAINLRRSFMQPSANPLAPNYGQGLSARDAVAEARKVPLFSGLFGTGPQPYVEPSPTADQFAKETTVRESAIRQQAALNAAYGEGEHALRLVTIAQEALTEKEKDKIGHTPAQIAALDLQTDAMTRQKVAAENLAEIARIQAGPVAAIRTQIYATQDLEDEAAARDRGTAALEAYRVAHAGEVVVRALDIHTAPALVDQLRAAAEGHERATLAVQHHAAELAQLDTIMVPTIAYLNRVGEAARAAGNWEDNAAARTVQQPIVAQAIAYLNTVGSAATKVAEGLKSEFADEMKTMLKDMQRAFASFFADVFKGGVTSFQSLFDAVRGLWSKMLGDLTGANLTSGLKGLLGMKGGDTSKLGAAALDVGAGIGLSWLSSALDNVFNGAARAAAAIRAFNLSMDEYRASITGDQQAQDIAKAHADAEAERTALAATFSSFSDLPRIKAGMEEIGRLEGIRVQQIKDEATAVAKADQVTEVRNRLTALTGTVTTLQAYSASLQLGTSSPLDPMAQYAEARRQYDATLTAAKAGDQTAAGKLATSAQAFLDASRAVNASGTAYAKDFAGVVANVDAVAQQFADQKSLAEQQLDALLGIRGAVEAIEAARDAAVQPAQTLLDALAAIRTSASASQQLVIDGQAGAIRDQIAAANFAAQAQIDAMRAGADQATLHQLATIDTLVNNRLAADTAATKQYQEAVKGGQYSASQLASMEGKRIADDNWWLQQIALAQRTADNTDPAIIIAPGWQPPGPPIVVGGRVGSGTGGAAGGSDGGSSGGSGQADTTAAVEVGTAVNVAGLTAIVGKLDALAATVDDLGRRIARVMEGIRLST
jgi:hypothetical protein